MIDIKTDKNMINALSLLKITQISEKEIAEGNLRKNEDVFNDLYDNVK